MAVEDSNNSATTGPSLEPSTAYDVEVVSPAGRQTLPDRLAVEEPLEIRWREAGAKDEGEPLAITMRTPGRDEYLVRGWLYAEGLVEADSNVEVHRPLGEDGQLESHIVIAELPGKVAENARALVRRMFVNSSCGFCGKPGLEGLKLPRTPRLEAGPRVSGAIIHKLPEVLEQSQPTFQHTGGLHAAALFDARGTLLAAEEDIGRHNAVDKLIGRGLEAGLLPGGDHLVLVSGRGGYELVQKCLVTDIAFMGAVSAPSSGAVALARRYGMTLVGFVREERFNVYSGGSRILDGGS